MHRKEKRKIQFDIFYNQLETVFCFSNGKIYFGKEDGKIEDKNAKLITTLPGPGIFQRIKKIVNCMISPRKNRLIVATFESGLFLLDINKSKKPDKLCETQNFKPFMKGIAQIRSTLVCRLDDKQYIKLHGKVPKYFKIPEGNIWHIKSYNDDHCIICAETKIYLFNIHNEDLVQLYRDTNKIVIHGFKSLVGSRSS